MARSVIQRAVQDVQRLDEDLQAEPFRTLGDQPVDLAGGQPRGRYAELARSPVPPACRHGLHRASLVLVSGVQVAVVDASDTY
jgi:hypothetical protein